LGASGFNIKNSEQPIMPLIRFAIMSLVCIGGIAHGQQCQYQLLKSVSFIQANISLCTKNLPQLNAPAIQDNLNTVTTDELTGHFLGMVDFPEGHMSGEATLVITGNRFKLSSGPIELTGTIVVLRHRFGAISFDHLKRSSEEGSDKTPIVISLHVARTLNHVEMRSSANEEIRFRFSSRSGLEPGPRRPLRSAFNQ
jgi:hypothetical protein